jgi:hypothetical protein
MKTESTSSAEKKIKNRKKNDQFGDMDAWF